jgi:hypothetical protein
VLKSDYRSYVGDDKAKYLWAAFSCADGRMAGVIPLDYEDNRRLKEKRRNRKKLIRIVTSVAALEIGLISGAVLCYIAMKIMR